MPYYKRKKYYRKKKNVFRKNAKASYYTNKRSGRNVITTLNKQMGVPDVAYTKLCVAWYMSQITTGTYTEVYLHLNSMIDPTGSSGIANYQPMFFDEYAAIYNKYKVTGAKVNFQFINNGAPVEIVSFANTTNAAATSMDEARERKGARYKLMPASQDKSIKSLSKYYNFRHIVGEELTDNNYEASVTANPAKIVYLHLGFLNAFRTGAAISVYPKGYMVLYAQFYDRKQVAQSVG